MPALGFKSEYVAPVLSGLKPITMRAGRRDGKDPRVGDPLYLFENWRTPNMRRFATARCALRLRVQFTSRGLVGVHFRGMDVAAPPVLVSVGNAVVDASGVIGSPTCMAALQRLAEWDGFASWEDLYSFHLGEDRIRRGRVAKYGETVDRELIGLAAVVAYPGTTPALPL